LRLLRLLLSRMKLEANRQISAKIARH